MGFSPRDHLWLSLFSCMRCLFLYQVVDRSLGEWVCACAIWMPDSDLYFSLSYSDFSKNSQARMVPNQSQLSVTCVHLYRFSWLKQSILRNWLVWLRGLTRQPSVGQADKPETQAKGDAVELTQNSFFETSGFARKVLAHWMGLTNIMRDDLKLTWSQLIVDINHIYTTTYTATPILIWLNNWVLWSNQGVAANGPSYRVKRKIPLLEVSCILDVSGKLLANIPWRNACWFLPCHNVQWVEAQRLSTPHLQTKFVSAPYSMPHWHCSPINLQIW